jgi:hypothetical protein
MPLRRPQNLYKSLRIGCIMEGNITLGMLAATLGEAMNQVAPAQDSAIQFSDFLNPASMLTPGLAGALAMMISNALFHAFGLNAAYTALALSFLLGTIVWVATAALLARCIYYVFNSLIIFSVAFGTNSFGLTTNAPTIAFNLSTAAYAQTNTTTNASAPEIRAKLNALVENAAKSGPDSPVVIAQKNSLSALISSTAKPIPAPQQKKTPAAPTSFFHAWHF